MQTCKSLGPLKPKRASSEHTLAREAHNKADAKQLKVYCIVTQLMGLN